MHEDMLPDLTSPMLILLHNTVRTALEMDDSLAPGQKKMYQAREQADWRSWSTAIEKEMGQRGIRYTKLPW